MNPNYKKIYTDIINKKCPKDIKLFQKTLNKKELDSVDIIRLNDSIFGKKNADAIKFNQQHRAYSREAILFILDFQKKKKYNNSQLSREFKISRNTIAKWKKIYI